MDFRIKELRRAQASLRRFRGDIRTLDYQARIRYQADDAPIPVLLCPVIIYLFVYNFVIHHYDFTSIPCSSSAT